MAPTLERIDQSSVARPRRKEKSNNFSIAFVGIYILLIIIVNYAFSVLPMIHIMGEHIPSATFLVGFIFVIRDYVQSSSGRNIAILAILFACIVSYLISDPRVAMASVVSFFVSEMIDTAVFSAKPQWSFSRRIFLSSVASTPVDSFIFLGMIGHLSATGLVLMTIAKLIGASMVSLMNRNV